MQVTNLTPHEVKVLGQDGNVLATLPSDGVARARQTDVPVGEFEIGGGVVPVVKTEFGDTDGLPEPAEGVAYVVSIITAQAAAAQGRSTTDLLLTSGPVRDDQGRIVGCRALARFS